MVRSKETCMLKKHVSIVKANKDRVNDIFKEMDSKDESAMSDPAATYGPRGGLAGPGLSVDESRLSAIGIPYEGGASARTGAAQGPAPMRY